MVVEKMMLAGLDFGNRASTALPGMAPMAAKCLPQAATDALDTAKLWVWIIAGVLAGIGLIIIGIKATLNARAGHGGSEILAGLGWWIFGVVLIAAATGIVQMFLGAATTCG